MALGDIELFSPYVCTFGSIVISDVINVDPNPQVNQIMGRAAGSLDVGVRGLANLDPRVGVTCLDLSKLADISGVNGVEITTASKIQYQKRGPGGQFESSGHRLLTAQKGFLLPESIQASQDQGEGAQMQLMFYPLWDGNNAIVAVSTGSLTGTPSVTLFKLGPCVLSGTTMLSVQSARVQFGLNFKTTRGSGEQYARLGSIYARDPSINVEPKNMTVLDTVGFGMVTGVTLTQYFRRVNAADNAGNHISVSCTGTLEVGNIAANPDDDPRPGLIAKPTAGTLSISTTANIPS